MEVLALSPDGTKIAFSAPAPRPGNNDIYELFILNINGSGIVQLTNENYASRIRHIAWSPDSSKIVFSRSISGDGIKTINADGTNLIHLASEQNVRILTPSWSNDGTSIIFVRNRDGNQEIYKMDADGSNVIRLTNNPADDLTPVWQP